MIEAGNQDGSCIDSLNSVNRDRIIVMIIINFLSTFILSDEYIQWTHDIESKEDDLSQALSKLADHVDYSDEEAKSFAKRDGLECKGLEYVHFKCIDDIFESYYLYNFIGTVECLPIGITLSQVARHSESGMIDFIMIYTNEMYSWMTGYIRKELVGSKLTDINKETKRDIVKNNSFVSDSLCQSNSFITALNSQHKNGDLFQQLLGIKPIFDSNGTFAYVIGIHMDVTIEYGTFWSNKWMTSLLSMLPSKLSALELPHVEHKYSYE